MTNHIDRIGKFEIIERLGEGGMGEVLLARDTIIGREVALKIIRKASLLPPDGQGRFVRESQAAGRLNHPNLVTIHEVADKGGVLFQVMDYVAGEDLGALLRDPAITAREKLEMLAQVCDGLAHIHQRGGLHRNLKPSNIRIGRVAGRPAPKILDGGLTRANAGDPAAVAANLASLAYTAPECLQSGKSDARADLFSVGVLLCEALTGIQPFAADTPAAVAQRVLHEEPPALDLDAFPELSPAIQGVLNHALAKDPARRFAQAEALAAALRSARDPSWTPESDPAHIATPEKPFLLPGLALPAAPAPSRAGLAWSALLAVIVAGALATAGGFWLRTRHRIPQAAGAATPAAPQAPPAPAPEPAPAPAPAPAAAPAPPAAPAPAAMPAPAAHPAGGVYKTLDEAADAVDKDPQGALAFLEPAVASDPGSERAISLRIIALYNLARYPACSKAIKDAREAGHPLWAMALRQPPLKAMLERDAKSPHLPRRKPAAPEAPAPEPAPAP